MHEIFSSLILYNMYFYKIKPQWFQFYLFTSLWAHELKEWKLKICVQSPIKHNVIYKRFHQNISKRILNWLDYRLKCVLSALSHIALCIPHRNEGSSVHGWLKRANKMSMSDGCREASLSALGYSFFHLSLGT